MARSEKIRIRTRAIPHCKDSFHRYVYSQQAAEMSEEELSVWTIGQSNRTLAEFKELLAYHSIEAVADVRRFPGSRKHPHFNEDSLRTSLAGLDIEYLALPE